MKRHIAGNLKKYIIVISVAVLLLCSMNLVVLADGGAVTDPALKQALIAAGFDNNPVDGEISPTELAAISGVLDLSGKGITDLNGLQYATGVTELNISGNSIRDIYCTASLPLTKLNASNNLIRDITCLSSLATLTELDVSGNYLDTNPANRAVTDALIGAGRAATYGAQKVAVTGVGLDATNIQDLNVGESVQLASQIAPGNATDKGVKWYSSDSAVATVDDTGKVTGVASSTVPVTITTESKYDANLKASCIVNVRQHVSKVELSSSSLLTCEGETVTLGATVSPDNASDKSVIWTSSDTDIATVTDGVVSIYAVGNVEIKAAAGNCEAVCNITIKTGKISSAKYNILTDGLITGVAKYTNLSAFKANLNNDDADIRVFKADGSELTGGVVVGTGMTAKLFVGDKERDALSVIVNGDVDGDGGITISDYSLVRLDILGLRPLSGPLHIGADVNNDGTVNISDYTLMRLDLLGLKPISVALPNLPEVSNPTIRRFLDIALSLQGKPYIWGDEGPASFDCSGFVYYCLKQAGYTGTLWRSTADSYSKWAGWTRVDRNALQPGDLMFYYSDNPNDGDHIGHIGIYLGNGYHIHASSDYGFVVICRVDGWYDRMLSHGMRVNF